MTKDVRVRTIAVAGGSMEPSLPKGSEVAVASVSPDELRPGDIVLLETASNRTIHRVIAVASIGGEQVVFHRGDNRGGIGVTDARATAGKAVAILRTPDGTSGRGAISPASPRALRIARLRCRLYCWAARMARVFGPFLDLVPEKLRARTRKAILG